MSSSSWSLNAGSRSSPNRDAVSSPKKERRDFAASFALTCWRSSRRVPTRRLRRRRGVPTIRSPNSPPSPVSEAINEVDFCGTMASAMMAIVATFRETCPFVEAHLGGMGIGKSKRARKNRVATTTVERTNEHNDASFAVRFSDALSSHQVLR